MSSTTQPTMSDGIGIFDLNRPIMVDLAPNARAKSRSIVHAHFRFGTVSRLRATREEMERQEGIRHMRVNAQFLAEQAKAFERFEAGEIDHDQYRAIVRDEQHRRDMRLAAV